MQKTTPWELSRPKAISRYLWLMAVVVTSSTPAAHTPCTPLGSNLRLVDTRHAARPSLSTMEKPPSSGE